MIRVLEVFGEPISRGGQESFVVSMLEHMNMTNLRIDLFTPYYCDNQIYKDVVSKLGGCLYESGNEFKIGGTRRDIIPCLEHFLLNHTYDVIHIHSGSTAVLAYYSRIAKKFGAKKVIVHSHSSGCKENFKHLLIKFFAYFVFKHYVTDFFACSEKAALWKFPRSVLKRVKIIKNGVDLKKFKFNPIIRSKMRKLYDISEDTPVLGNVGRFTCEKNQIFLIKFFYEFKKIHKNVKLVLVGEGECLSSVKKEVERMNLAKDVIFTGSKDNVADFLDMFDVFLFPSFYEGLGIAGIEAQASGLPVVASTGVPNEMKVTEFVSFVSLDDITNWCIEVKNMLTVGRKNKSLDLKINGYDIDSSSSTVRAVYLTTS